MHSERRIAQQISYASAAQSPAAARLIRLVENATGRMALMLREFRQRIEGPVRLSVGRPIPPDALAADSGDPGRLTARLRAATYALAADPAGAESYGLELEAHNRQLA